MAVQLHGDRKQVAKVPRKFKCTAYASAVDCTNFKEYPTERFFKLAVNYTRMIIDDVNEKNRQININIEHNKEDVVGKVKKATADTMFLNKKHYQPCLKLEFDIDNYDFIAALKEVTADRYSHTSPNPVMSSDGFFSPEELAIINNSGRNKQRLKKTKQPKYLDLTAKFCLTQKMPEISMSHNYKDNTDWNKLDEVSLCVAGARNWTIITDVQIANEADEVNVENKDVLHDLEVDVNRKNYYIKRLASLHAASNIHSTNKVKKDYEDLDANNTIFEYSAAATNVTSDDQLKKVEATNIITILNQEPPYDLTQLLKTNTDKLSIESAAENTSAFISDIKTDNKLRMQNNESIVKAIQNGFMSLKGKKRTLYEDDDDEYDENNAYGHRIKRHEKRLNTLENLMQPNSNATNYTGLLGPTVAGPMQSAHAALNPLLQRQQMLNDQTLLQQRQKPHQDDSVELRKRLETLEDKLKEVEQNRPPPPPPSTSSSSPQTYQQQQQLQHQYQTFQSQNPSISSFPAQQNVTAQPMIYQGQQHQQQNLNNNNTPQAIPYLHAQNQMPLNSHNGQSIAQLQLTNNPNFQQLSVPQPTVAHYGNHPILPHMLNVTDQTKQQPKQNHQQQNDNQELIATLKQFITTVQPKEGQIPKEKPKLPDQAAAQVHQQGRRREQQQLAMSLEQTEQPMEHVNNSNQMAQLQRNNPTQLVQQPNSSVVKESSIVTVQPAMSQIPMEIDHQQQPHHPHQQQQHQQKQQQQQQQQQKINIDSNAVPSSSSLSAAAPIYGNENQKPSNIHEYNLRSNSSKNTKSKNEKQYSVTSLYEAIQNKMLVNNNCIEELPMKPTI